MKSLTGLLSKIAAGTLLLCLGSSAMTQRSGPPQMPGGSSAPSSQNPFGQTDTKSRIDPTLDPAEKQARMRNEERQRRLVSDTEKLLSLATELHQDVARTNRNMLSVDVIKRADEIERLAHGVKERMKG